jgi:uncharacterized circularly permuted ATP-grasp superfamily protein
VDHPIDSLFGPDAGESPAALAAALAQPAAPGHYDELRGAVSPSAGRRTAGIPAEPWARFFDQLGRDGLADLNRRTAQLQRQVRDNGVTYNV